MRRRMLTAVAVATFCLCGALLAQTEEALQKELHAAIKAGNVNKINEILDKSPALARKEIKYHSFPVIEAVRARNFNSLKALLDKGADPKQKFPQSDDTLLHILAARSHGLKQEQYEQFLELLVKECKLSMEAKNKTGATPLILAFSDTANLRAASTLNPVIEAFTKYGANVNAQDSAGMTPLLHVVSRVQFKDLDTKDKFNNALSPAKLLVEKGAKVDTPAKDKATPLFRLLSRSKDLKDDVKVDLVGFMLDNGANPRARGPNKQTPLDLVAKDGELFTLMTQARKKK